MGEQDRRPDLLQQRRQGGVDQLLGLLGVGQERDLAGEELVEGGVALHAGPARPAGMELGLRVQVVDLRRRVGPLQAAGAEPVVGAVDFRVGARAPAPDLIDHVDLIAPLDEALHPARAAVRGGEVVHAGLGETVHHHHRVGLGDPGRGARLHEHLADHHGPVADLLVAAADVEIARPGHRLGRLRRPGRFLRGPLGSLLGGSLSTSPGGALESPLRVSLRRRTGRRRRLRRRGRDRSLRPRRPRRQERRLDGQQSREGAVRDAVAGHTVSPGCTHLRAGAYRGKRNARPDGKAAPSRTSNARSARPPRREPR